MTHWTDIVGVTARRAPRKKRARGAQRFLIHNQLLGARLYLYSLARFAVVGVIAAGALFAKYVVGVEDLDIPHLLGVAAMLGMYNCAVFFMIRPLRDRERAEIAYSLLAGIMHATIMLDFVFLTLALWLVGGARSPFQAFYVFNVILASVLLTRLSAFLHTAFGYLLLALLIVGEWREWIPPFNPVGATFGPDKIDGRMVVTLLAVDGLLFALSASILTSLTQVLRSGERELRDVNAALEHLSAMRRDFLQMVLHDLKTPIVAVTQHLYNLDAQLHERLSDVEQRWMDRCRVRLKDLSALLSDLQVLALLESETLQKKKAVLDLPVLLAALVAEAQDLAQMRNHTLELETAGPLPVVRGIERLFREAVSNLITNAIKYTPSGGRIVVRANAVEDGVCIEIQDNGIGISIEDQRRLFQEFGRVRPKTGEDVDTTGSSGLGLAIVRRAVELHGGTVEVESELNHGSTFRMILPAEE